MDIQSHLAMRRSIRAFKSDPVPREQIEQLVAAAMTAPTACDRQLWHFILFDDPALIRQLADRGAAAFIERAPAGILVLYDNRTPNIEYMDHVQSAAAAIENLLLAAAARDLGACWVCHLPPKRQLRRLLRIPPWFDPIAYVALGYPKNVPKPKSIRAGLETVVSYNGFESTREVRHVLGSGWLKRMVLGGYFRLPIGIRKRLARSRVLGGAENEPGDSA